MLNLYEAFVLVFSFYCKGRLQKKKSKKSDIVTKGRVGWGPKPYF